VREDPRQETPDELLKAARRRFAEQRFADVRALCERGLRQDPSHAELRHVLAFALAGEGRSAAAAEELGRVLALRGEDARLLGDLGVLLGDAGQIERAAALLRRAVTLAPDLAMLHFNLGNAEFAIGALPAAMASFRRAAELDPGMADAFNNLGAAARKMGDLDTAIAGFRQAIALQEGLAAAHANLGIALARRGAHREALENLRRALVLDPGHIDARIQLAQSLACVGEWGECFAIFDALERSAPASAQASNEHGAALLACGRAAASLPRFDRALALDPSFAEAYVNRATALLALGQFEDADGAARRGFELAPQLTLAASVHLTAARAVGDWSEEPELLKQLRRRAQERPEEVDPLAFLRVIDDPPLQRRVAGAHAPRWTAPAQIVAPPHGRLRLCYMSGDFRAHPVGESVVELLELHDRDQFEVIGASWGADDGSSTAKRIRAACDQFLDFSIFSDAAAAAALRRMSPDIAIDLVGFTAARRPVMLEDRPAPIIVNYLGYAGTLGTPAVDYLLADRTVIPSTERDSYAEQIAWLPHSFFPTDTRTAPAAECSRESAGLPPRAVLLCGLCNLQKLSAELYASWMRILTAVPNAVLWLQADAEAARRNLRQSAGLHGVDAARLIFAGRVESRAHHLARLRLADLMLDTFPYGGHSTSRDALWAGLPVLTRAGRGFASRVSASLLHALGLDDLIVGDGAAYEARAIELAAGGGRLREYRRQLEAAKTRTPLFATATLCRDIESAYAAMDARRRAGLPAADIEVPGGASPGPAFLR